MYSTRTKLQLIVLAAVTTLAGAVVVFGYMRLPEQLGYGRYTVRLELPRAAGLYPNGNVTYRGVEVGRVRDVRLTDSGVEARLSLNADVPVPADVRAEVHSVSAIGEQYVDLLPQSSSAPMLADNDVIPARMATVPPRIDQLLESTNRGLQAIPNGDLKTVIDEAATGLSGLGPELHRVMNGSVKLANDAGANLDALTALIERTPAVLQTQTDSSDQIRAWAASMASVTGQVASADRDLTALLDHGRAAAAEASQLLERLRPTIPVLMANLASTAEVMLDYEPAIEQILVLLPQGVAATQAAMLPDLDAPPAYAGLYMDFNLNINLPPPCTTGFLPAQQRRPPSEVDYPDRPAGDLYCRIPQDAPNDVRGARNLPCLTVPGKRAPTAKMCESDESFVALNEGNNWKGDPNATLSGQPVPQLTAGPAARTQSPLPPAALDVVPYDPATGAFIGPDGATHVRTDLAAPHQVQSWQAMLLPPG